jgi:hypothetical protein
MSSHSKDTHNVIVKRKLGVKKDIHYLLHEKNVHTQPNKVDRTIETTGKCRIMYAISLL